jgi:prepilin-type N-terminal cleavage/methylation domain-containing protein
MNQKSGFTLIEVVLAIAVGLIIIATVVIGYSYAKRSAITDNQRKELDSKFYNGDIPNQEDKVAGDKPTESDFKDVIDSSLNISEDKTKYTSSSNLSPTDKTEFSAEDAIKSITFRWTPVVPKPQQPVTYRMKVWQLMQGQSGSAAMKTNQPIVTKDVDNLTEASVSNIYTGPCKPPYLCDFVWNVEASIAQTGAVPKVIATSASSSFSVKEPPATDGGTSAGTSGATQ